MKALLILGILLSGSIGLAEEIDSFYELFCKKENRYDFRNAFNADPSRTAGSPDKDYFDFVAIGTYTYVTDRCKDSTSKPPKAFIEDADSACKDTCRKEVTRIKSELTKDDSVTDCLSYCSAVRSRSDGFLKGYRAALSKKPVCETTNARPSDLRGGNNNSAR
ncbi:MAG: hypothetical protein AB7F59_01985 [Bdellovibrionales bacterium]